MLRGPLVARVAGSRHVSSSLVRRNVTSATYRHAKIFVLSTRHLHITSCNAARHRVRDPRHSQRPPQNHDVEHPSSIHSSEHASSQASLSTALAEQSATVPTTPVRIPHDRDGVLGPSHPAFPLLNNSSLVIQRQIEMMNIFLGFEQANRYVIMNELGETIGYLAEQDHGLGSAMARQMFKTHRSFTSHIFDVSGCEVLRIHRPFAWINSKISIYDPVSADSHSAQPPDSNAIATIDTVTSSVSSLPLSEMRVIGETQQIWAPLRRKYALFTHRPLQDIEPATPDTNEPDLGMAQFASIDAPFLSWDFTLESATSIPLGSVNRSFRGLGRELFTDTGAYALRMDSAALQAAADPLRNPRSAEESALSLDQRAVMLASAVSIDFDYFSRHSGHGGFMPFPIWFGGAGAEAGAAGAGVAGAGAGAAAETGAIGAATSAGTMAGVGAVEGLSAGAAGAAGAVASGAVGSRGWGTDAGYDDQSPQSWYPPTQTPLQNPDQYGSYGGVEPQQQGYHGQDQTGAPDSDGPPGDDGEGFDWSDLF